VTNADTPVLALWSDDPAPTDLLSFDAVAATVADALLDQALDPVALGLSISLPRLIIPLVIAAAGRALDLALSPT
jgi:hypothetical protein